MVGVGRSSSSALIDVLDGGLEMVRPRELEFEMVRVREPVGLVSRELLRLVCELLADRLLLSTMRGDGGIMVTLGKVLSES